MKYKEATNYKLSNLSCFTSHIRKESSEFERYQRCLEIEPVIQFALDIYHYVYMSNIFFETRMMFIYEDSSGETHSYGYWALYETANLIPLNIIQIIRTNLLDI